MKKAIVYGWVICLTALFLAGYSHAEDIYVTGVTKITMRTGPGVEHKIVVMLQSGTKLEIIDYSTDWSRVKTSDGREGWVLSRFLTQKVPDALLVQQLKKENAQLSSRLEKLEDENKNFTIKNASLVQIESKYNRLKKESAEFLKLEKKYEEMTQQFEGQQKKIESLEQSLNNEPKYWYLIGPGVFIVGLFFGLSTRKKKRSSLV